MRINPRSHSAAGEKRKLYNVITYSNAQSAPAQSTRHISLVLLAESLWQPEIMRLFHLSGLASCCQNNNSPRRDCGESVAAHRHP